MAKQVVIVYEKKAQQAARRWLITIGNAPGHKANLNTEDEYTKDEQSKPSTQPVVFVGPSKPALDINDTLPVAFSEFGATCRLSGRKAVVICDWPDDMPEKDARAKALQMGQSIKDLTGRDNVLELAQQIEAPLSEARRRESQRRTDPWDRTMDFLSRYSGLDSFDDYRSDMKIQKQYVELLYLYAAHRFVAEYLDDFAAD